jgi:formylglycine-generating enzyme required for sulfatase activity
MVWVPGGIFLMGSEDFYPEERPVREVAVDGFWIDQHQVTVAEFRRYVKATGYVTVAERALNAADYPEADPALLVPGSLVFRKTRGPVNLNDYRNWWEYVPGACWRNPEGPGSDVGGRDRHPVTHRCIRRCGILCAVGRQGLAHRGRMGVRRTRRHRSQDIRLG